MSVLVKTKTEQEEKVLLAFLNSLQYIYQAGIEGETDQINASFLDQYNLEIDHADSEIECGDFVKHEDVELLFQQRRKAI